ncbi:MAG: CDP-alcohol phosphatidyltransferase family protein [Micropepsaceae bacterium]
MLDGLKRDWAEPLWNSLAKPLAKAGLTPNQITLLGLVLVVLNCALFCWHKSTFWLGLGLAVSFAFDALDGAVARLRNMSSKFGGYLDGVIDRYQEIVVFASIAWVTGWWALSFFALTGSLMVSYNKARAAIEIPIENHAWPDLLERFERVVILSLALLLDSFVTLPDVLGGRVLFLALLVLGALAHLTAIQRFFRARRMLTPDD